MGAYVRINTFLPLLKPCTIRRDFSYGVRVFLPLILLISCVRKMCKWLCSLLLNKMNLNMPLLIKDWISFVIDSLNGSFGDFIFPSSLN